MGGGGQGMLATLVGDWMGVGWMGWGGRVVCSKGKLEILLRGMWMELVKTK